MGELQPQDVNHQSHVRIGEERFEKALGREETGLTCRVNGCDNLVNTYKGLGGWCAVLQDSGGTHRQDEIARRKGEPIKKPASEPQDISSAAVPHVAIANKFTEALDKLIVSQEDWEDARAEWNETLDSLKLDV